jgi:hypothetical protein
MSEQRLEELKESVAEDVVNSLDLSGPLAEEATQKEEANETADPVVEEADEQETETEDEDEGAEAEEESDGGEEVEEETDEVEDVIPKSKHESALKKMERRINQLTAENKDFKDKMSTKDDDNMSKLESMSETELENLSADIQLTLVEGEREGKELSRSDKLELIKFQKKIDRLQSTAPQRFQNKQVKHLESIVPEIEEIYPDFRQQWANKKGPLFDLGISLYQQTQSFQSNELGLVDAFNLAVRHLGGQGQKSQGKNLHLKRQVNNLKKKTSLSGRTLKPDMTKERSKKQWKRALEGGADDKASWVHDNILPNMR